MVDQEKKQSGGKKEEGEKGERIRSALCSRCCFNDFLEYAKGHKGRVVTYILAAIGLLLLFVRPMIGGFIMGGIGGFYFSNQIVYFLRGLSRFFAEESLFNYAVMTLILVGLFIAAPSFFLGAFCTVVLRQLVKRG